MSNIAEAHTVHVPFEVAGAEAPTTDQKKTSTDARTYGEDKFSSVEELEQAYLALKQAGKQQEPQTQEGTTQQQQQQPEVAPKEAPDAEASRAEADKTLQSKGLDLSSFEQEWSQSGELSEDSYKALEKSGLPKALVERYIEGQTALMNAFVGEVQQLTGGPEGYNAMTEWAKESLPPQEVNAFNTIMNKGDKEEIKLAVSGMLARYRDAEGHTPTLASGKASAGAGQRDAFQSTAQVVEAMKDKRYGKDTAYTKAVEEKMRRSNIFG